MLNLLALAVLTAPLQVASDEILFVLESGGASGRIHQLDPVTALKQATAFIPGNTRYYWSMAHDGQRLLAIDTFPLLPSNAIERIAPASAETFSSSSTGENWSNFALDVDPTTGTLYAAYGTDLFTLDPDTGQLTFVAEIYGLQLGDCVCSMAIHPNGTAYASGLGNSALYELDLKDGSALHLGNLQIPVGSFYDLAFDSQGNLWGSYRASALWYRGLYRINYQDLTVTFAGNPGTSGLYGIAFGPGTPETIYCSPKTGSAGCTPTIEAAGIASPTASLGYEVSASGVRNNSIGVLLYTTNGAVSNPFAGATMCIAAPRKRTALVDSGGSPPPAQDCSGRWTYDLNTHLQAKPGPVAGDTLHCQWIGRDPGFPPAQAYALSNALQFTLLP